MKHIAYLTLKALVVVALAVPAFAGGDCKTSKCEATAQTCINKITTKVANKGWLGVELEKDMVIKKVVAESPAASAYLKAGDQLVALNGVKYSKEKTDAMKAAYKQVRPGNTVTYTIVRDGKQKDVKVKLGHFPQEIVARWVGDHMLESHAEVAHVN